MLDWDVTFPIPPPPTVPFFISNSLPPTSLTQPLDIIYTWEKWWVYQHQYKTVLSALGFLFYHYQTLSFREREKGMFSSSKKKPTQISESTVLQKWVRDLVTLVNSVRFLSSPKLWLKEQCHEIFGPDGVDG